MADVRALLAAEKSSRRITHPHAAYTKSGILSCKACDLSIKSEALWEGHLRSANHRKNAAKAAAVQLNQEYSVPSSQRQAQTPAATVVTTSRNLKRKIDDVEEPESQLGDRDYEVDGRKKPRSRVVSAAGEDAALASSVSDNAAQTRPERTPNGNRNGTVNGKHVHFSPSITAGSPDTRKEKPHTSSADTEGMDMTMEPDAPSLAVEQKNSQDPQTAATEVHQAQEQPQQTGTAIDEDEWAAFESEIATLEHQSIPSTSAPNTTGSLTKSISNSSAAGTIIEAAPVTSTEIAQQHEQDQQQKQKLKLLDTQLDEEKEDESRRMEEEFEIMEEMESKVRRLREMRERLRLPSTLTSDSDIDAANAALPDKNHIPSDANGEAKVSRHDRNTSNRADSTIEADNEQTVIDESEKVNNSNISDDEDEGEDDWYA